VAAPRWGSVPEQGPKLWFLTLGFFLAVGALEATHGWIGYRLGGGPVLGLTVRGQPMGWFGFFARTTPSWLTVGFLATIAITLLRRFPLDGERRRRNLFMHFASATAFGFAFIAVAAAFRYHLFLKHEIATTYLALLIRYYAVYFNTFFLVYWALAAVWTASRYQARHRDALVLERDLAEARLQSLQAQLRPHFLFNALNAITTLAHEGDRVTVVRMLTTLAKLLRASFSNPGTQFVRLSDEIAFSRRYLDLERMRFPDRLTVEIRVDPATEDVVVPRFLLQPLVENAVRHGVAASPRSGRVTIVSLECAGAVELCVDDTGPGLAPDATEGTGLGNTRRRLEHAFGSSARLDLARAPDGGCRARVRLPARHAEPVELACAP
jgi:signal transduction histidine kinase